MRLAFEQIRPVQKHLFKRNQLIRKLLEQFVLLLATIGQRFRFELTDEKVEVLPVLSLRPKNGIKVRLHKRGNDSSPLVDR